MSEANDKWSNELMDEEDQLHEQMQAEFRQRLQKRLQKKLEAKQKEMPEVRNLKKKGQSGCD